MSIYPLVMLIPASLVFLFLVWQNLQEDYKTSSVFTFGFYILGFLYLGLLIAKVTNPLFWFWFAFAGSVSGFALGTRRADVKLLDGLEASTIALLFLLFFVASAMFLKYYNPETFATMIFILWLILLYYFVKTKYKSIGWYKSGKLGFCALTVASIFFGFRIPVALFFPNMISFLGKIDVIPSFFVSLFYVVSLLRLSRTK